MALEPTYAEPGTDSCPPLSEYRDHERSSLSIVSDAEEIAPLRSPTVFRVWVNGTLHRRRAYERICAWMLVSSATTTKFERTTAEELPPQLPAEVETSIKKLVNLPPGWDGYDGIPVRPEVAQHARRFMSVIRDCTQLVPDFVPLSDGGLQLEWFVGAYEVEVAIAPDGTAHVYFECTNDGRIKEFSLGNSLDIEEIAPFFQELRR